MYKNSILKEVMMTDLCRTLRTQLLAVLLRRSLSQQSRHHGQPDRPVPTGALRSKHTAPTITQNCSYSGGVPARDPAGTDQGPEVGTNHSSGSQLESEEEKDLALFPNPSDLNMFVPKSEAPSERDIDGLQTFVRTNKRLLVLTGAGLSTESGIPDYRSEGVGLYARSTNRPVQYADFVKFANIRQRYWARNYVGWPKFGFFLPNSSHLALSNWERLGKIHWLVTQNVDALHYKAGSKKVTELHGSAHRVMCLDCPSKMTRPQMQDLILSHNPTWTATSDEMAPDADVQLTSEQIEGFKVPPCPNCGGRLKPEITFFGDNVAKPVVEFVHQRVRESDAVLLVGTSLQVYSGYRFVLAAKDQKKPIGIVNIGPTRADKHADLIVNTKCGDILPHVKLQR